MLLYQVGQVGRSVPHPDGGDPLFGQVGLLLLFNESNGSTAPTDSSSHGHAVTAVGTNPPIIDNPGGLDGGAIRSRATFLNNSYNIVAFDSSFSLAGTQDFCVEGWINSSNVSTPVAQGIIEVYNTTGSPTASAQQFYVRINGGKLSCSIVKTNSVVVALSNATAIPANTWVHFAMIRSGDTLYLVQDGVIVASAAITGPNSVAAGGAQPLIINRALPSGGTSQFAGKIDSIRITVGNRRYSPSGFTPPADEFLTF